MEKMLEKVYEIVSEKHGINGTINDYGVVIKLNFEYDGKSHEIALHRPFPADDQAMEKLGIDTIDSYIDNLALEQESDRKLQLHYWYINKHVCDGQEYIFANGIVSGHTRLADSTFIHTSAVEDIIVDPTIEEEVLVKTKNSLYHCPLTYCKWEEQEKNKELIPDFEWLRGLFERKKKIPTIEEDKVLLVLSNYDEFYFNSLYYKPSGAETNLEFFGSPHIGMFQDSFLIRCHDAKIDLRYFPHYQNIEFYMEQTEEHPLYVENIGDVTLYVRSSKGVIRLDPGDRKEVSEANAEEERPILPGGDLYPAGIIDG